MERISVRNFQSLRKIDLELGRLTVIVGPSSSGKTSLLRACRALASNLRGTGAITRGATRLAITVHTSEAVVTLERGETAGLYRVTPVGGIDQVYAKLAGAVPAAVTAALRIHPVPSGGVSINFSGQFDPPYLLGDSGANVARELGELTNVTTILEAVRHANRLRNAHAATLRTRQSDLAEIVQRAEGFAALPTQLLACERAEKTAERAVRLTDQVQQLHAATQALVVAEGVLERSSALPTVPSGDAVTQAHARLTQLQGLVQEWVASARAAANAADTIGYWQQQETAFAAELRETLVRAGVCPTCGHQIE